MAGNRIDEIRPDAPELAARGPFAAGVRTIKLVNRDQIDIAAIEPGKPHPRADRKFTLEVWYPAQGEPAPCRYENVILRDGRTRVTLHGTAIRDGAPLTLKSPLAIISHGYPGNRFLISHLGENLATKGYVVASMDHPQSTYDDQRKFGSTLVHRPLDQLFVLNEMARLTADPESFLHGVIDASSAALIGYSMGGYGAIIAAGGGVAPEAVEFDNGAPEGTLGIHLAGSPAHAALPDPRVRAIVAFAPWGMQRGVWDSEGLAGIKTPMMIVAGDADDVSGYEDGPRAIFEQAVNSPRCLLTFENANHNVAAPIPAADKSWTPVDWLDFVPFEHYADPVWDNVRMNNIAQHFVTAWLGLHLKGDASMAQYLDLVEQSRDGVWAVDEAGRQLPGHSYWKGFPNRTAAGLSLRRKQAGEG